MQVNVAEDGRPQAGTRGDAGNENCACYTE
jgi:hypothetical protein